MIIICPNNLDLVNPAHELLNRIVYGNGLDSRLLSYYHYHSIISSEWNARNWKIPLCPGNQKKIPCSDFSKCKKKKRVATLPLTYNNNITQKWTDFMGIRKYTSKTDDDRPFHWENWRYFQNHINNMQSHTEYRIYLAYV